MVHKSQDYGGACQIFKGSGFPQMQQLLYSLDLCLTEPINCVKSKWLLTLSSSNKQLFLELCQCFLYLLVHMHSVNPHQPGHCSLYAGRYIA